jgi:predicted RNA-binding Zn-ribbon protein involved in translation (DUF1610 family)
MMKKAVGKKSAAFTIDLTTIEGDGAFPCPKCGTMISPEDESEKLYKIVETKVVNEELVELVVMCRNCESTIKLAGFEQTIEGVPSE